MLYSIIVTCLIEVLNRLHSKRRLNTKCWFHNIRRQCQTKFTSTHVLCSPMHTDIGGHNPLLPITSSLSVLIPCCSVLRADQYFMKFMTSGVTRRVLVGFFCDICGHLCKIGGNLCKIGYNFYKIG